MRRSVLLNNDYCLNTSSSSKFFKQGGNAWNLLDFDYQSAAIGCVDTIKYYSIPSVPSRLEATSAHRWKERRVNRCLRSFKTTIYSTWTKTGHSQIRPPSPVVPVALAYLCATSVRFNPPVTKYPPPPYLRANGSRLLSLGRSAWSIACWRLCPCHARCELCKVRATSLWGFFLVVHFR